MPNLKHLDNFGTARFVTFSTYKRIPILSHKSSRIIFMKQLAQWRANKQIKILGYVLMPNHVHLVLLLPEEFKLGIAIGHLKAKSARQMLEETGPEALGVSFRTGSQGSAFAVWQRRCYDHNCRTEEDTIEKINYCHNNPVKAGFVDFPEKWLWSSYNWYNRSGEVLLEIDRLDQ